jgi:hypothetical protein
MFPPNMTFKYRYVITIEMNITGMLHSDKLPSQDSHVYVMID